MFYTLVWKWKMADLYIFLPFLLTNLLCQYDKASLLLKSAIFFFTFVLDPMYVKLNTFEVLGDEAGCMFSWYYRWHNISCKRLVFIQVFYTFLTTCQSRYSGYIFGPVSMYHLCISDILKHFCTFFIGFKKHLQLLFSIVICSVKLHISTRFDSLV